MLWKHNLNFRNVVGNLMKAVIVIKV